MKKLWVILFVFAFGMNAGANNIKINKGPKIVNDHPVSDSILTVKFDLSWENSWRSLRVGHYDAAWIFIKYRSQSFIWKQAYLKNTGHKLGASSSPAPDSLAFSLGTSDVNGETKNMGVFLFRTSEDTYGHMDIKDVELKWDVKGITFEDTVALSVRVFAIEMVYIPEGPFVIGDNVSSKRLLKYGQTLTYADPTHTSGGIHAAGLAGRTSIFPKATGATGYVTSIVKYTNRSQSNACDLGTDARGNYDSYLTGWNRYQCNYGCGYYGNSWCGNYCCNSFYRSTPNWQAFDQNASTAWKSVEGTAWNWIQYQLYPGEGKKATWMLIHMRNDFVQHGFYVMGSNDGINFKLVHGVPGQYYSGATYFVSDMQYTPIKFDFPAHYEYYRFYFYNDLSHSLNYHSGEDNETTEIYDIRLFDDAASDINRIESENELTFINGVGTELGKVPQDFPKGYKAFYIMKHEVTQSAWVDFLNTLTFSQQRWLTPSGVAPFSSKDALVYPGGRIMIRIKEPSMDGEPAVYGLSQHATTWGDEENGGCIAMNNLSWYDGSAYLDWAALRPLSELEYEKASRGDRRPVLYETSWGMPLSKATAVTTLQDPYRKNELALPDASCYSTPNGTSDPQLCRDYWPVRAGIFAKSSVTRREAGSSYYAVMNLADNVPELYVNVQDAKGRLFKGTHGDGILDPSNGFHNVSDWPVPKSGSGQGLGYKGIAVSSESTSGGVVTSTVTGVIPVSNRDYISTTWSVREKWTGIRGGRTAEANILLGY